MPSLSSGYNYLSTLSAGQLSRHNGTLTNPWAEITHEVDDAPWKTPEQLVAERESSGPLHKPIHGRNIPVFRGAYKRQGDLFWADPVAFKDFKRLSGSGKGGDGGGSSITISSSSGVAESGYVSSFAIGLGRNEFQKPLTLLRVMADETIIYDAVSGNPTFSGMTMRTYDGIDNVVDPTMLARDGAAQTPAYNGYAYLFFENFRVEDFGYRIPIITAEVTDDADALSETYTISYLAQPPDFSIQTILCYDISLNRFYLTHEEDPDTAVSVGITSFDGREDVSLFQLFDFPSSDLNDIFGACAIPGTGLAMTTSFENSGSDVWALLVNAETGQVHASQAYSTVDNLGDWADWACALPLVGGSESIYIAVAITVNTGAAFDLPVAFAAVNYTDRTFEFITYGHEGNGNGGDSIVTPGQSGVNGTTFYVAQKGSLGSIWELLFTDTTVPTFRKVYTFGSGEVVSGVYYDVSLDRIVASFTDGSDHFVTAVEADDGAVAWRTVPLGSSAYKVIPGGGANYTTFSHIGPKFTHRLRSGYAVMVRSGAASADTYRLIDMRDGSFTTIDGSDLLNVINHYDQHTGTVYRAESGEWQAAAAGRYTAGDIPIAEVLTDFAVYAGYTQAQITTSGLSGYTCKGLFIERDSTIQNLARQVGELFGIDIVESGDAIKFVRKSTGGAFTADVAIAESELVAIPVDDATAHVQSSRQYEDDVPSELEARYIDSDADFEMQSQLAQRPNGVFEVTLSARKETISVPLVMTATNVKQRITERLYSWVSGQNTNRVILPPEHIAVEPSDVLEITADGVVRTVKVSRGTLRPDYTQEVDLIEYLVEDDTSVIGDTGIINNSEKTTEPHPSRYLHMDLPLLRFQHDTAGGSLVQYHVITGRGQTTWDGGSIWRRGQGGDWEKVITVAGVYPTVAVCTNALAAPAVDWSTDYDNTVTLRIIAGSSDDIQSSTYDEVMAGANNAAIGRPGRWEIIQWITATANADGSITLSKIVRGHRGTEAYSSTHEVGDYFVILRSEYLKELFHDTGDLDATYYYRAVGRFQNLSDAAIDTHTISGAAETPYAPSNLDASISGSDIDLSWTRRTRLSSPWKDDGSSTEAPLGETSKLYDIEIMDSFPGSSPDPAVLRTISNVTTESYTYPDADIISDFGSMPSVLTFRVYQRSEIIGRGHKGEATVELS